MPKKQIFSKFKIKDYNEELEKILEQKAFSSQVKSLLLSMFYKLEIGYTDYAVVKQDVPEKQAFMENLMYLIKEKCDEIEIMNPSENDERKYQAYKDEKKILCYQNEAAILHAILELSDREFLVKDSENILEIPIQTMLKEGDVLDTKEALINFDGWAWNNNFDNTDCIEYFVIYECLKILMGSSFMSEWRSNNKERKNFLEEIQRKNKALFNKLCETCIIVLCSKSEGKTFIKNNLKRLRTELDKMQEKTEFLREIYSEKNEIQNKIKKLNKIANDNDLLKEEFINRNINQPDDKKIFSISDLSDVIQVEIEEYSKKLEEDNKILLPKNYLKKMKAIEEKIDIIEESNIRKTKANDIYLKQIEFHDCFLDTIKKEISNINDRKEITQLIYNYRYYMYLPIRQNNEIILIKDIPELKNKVEQIFKKIITKACKLNVLIIINEDIEHNYRIMKSMLDTKLIKLEDIMVFFQENKENIEIQIYDGEIIDHIQTEPKENKKDFRVKFGKKVKIFT